MSEDLPSVTTIPPGELAAAVAHVEAAITAVALSPVSDVVAQSLTAGLQASLAVAVGRPEPVTRGG